MTLAIICAGLVLLCGSLLIAICKSASRSDDMPEEKPVDKADLF